MLRLTFVYFLAGINGAIFNATHAITNGRWHRTPDQEIVQRLLFVSNTSSQCRSRLRFSRNGISNNLVQPGSMHKHINGTLVNLVIVWGETFQHTVLEVLPRLSVFIAALETRLLSVRFDILSPLTFLVNDHSSLLLDVLNDLLSSPMFSSITQTPSKILAAVPGMTYTADVILFPTLSHQERIGLLPAGIFCPIFQYFTSPPVELNVKHKLVYLARPRNSARSLVEQTEKLLILKLKQIVNATNGQWDFVIWNTKSPTHGWKHGRDVIASAGDGILIGPHGGAFANMIFTRKMLRIVEIVPRKYIERPMNGMKGQRPCFMGLAHALGLEYWQVEPTSFDFERPNVDIYDLTYLLNLVNFLMRH